MQDEGVLGESLWSVTAPPAPVSAPLAQAENADVAVVGAGYTGCSAALHLAESGANVVVLEAGDIGAGASGRNTGFVNPALFASPSAVVAALGRQAGERLIEGLGGATTLVRDLIVRHRISCDTDLRPIVRGAHSDAALANLISFGREWKERGAHIETLSPADIEAMTGIGGTVGGMLDLRSFVIQPLAYVRGLAAAAVAAGVRLYTQSPALSLERLGAQWRIRTPSSSLIAERVILATGAYAGDLVPSVRGGFLPIGAHLYATGPLPQRLRTRMFMKASAFYDTRKGMVSVRPDRDGRLLIATLGYLPRFRRLGDAWFRKTLGRLFPDFGEQAIVARWGGSIDLTPDRLPRLAEPAPGVLATFGYNGRGIAPGTLWGKALADMALGRADPLIPFWKQQRIAFRDLRAWALQLGFGALMLTALKRR